MPAVRKLVVVLAAASVVGLVSTAAFGSSSDVQTASYPWVQPPVWHGLVPASQAEWPTTTSYAPTQPPACVPTGPAPAYRASTGYVWAQPWSAAPATACPSTQPPASIPTAGVP